MKYVIIAAFLLLLPLNAEAARFYIDPACTTPGTGVSPTCDGAGGDDPLATARTFTDVTRVAGDVGIMKRGVATTTDPGVAQSFTTDGTLNAPITLMSDYDNAFGNFATSSQTVTAKYGSVFMLTSASTTDMFPHQWIYIAGDCYEAPLTTSPNGCEFAYEIRTASSTGIELYLPYKGNQAGSGKVTRVMPFISNIGIETGATQIFTMSADDYWNFKGLDLRSTNTTVLVAGGSSAGAIFSDLVVQSNGVSVTAITTAGADANPLQKLRVFNVVSVFQSSNGINVKDFFFDCNNVALSIAFGSNNSFGQLVSAKDGSVLGCANFTAPTQNGTLSYFTNVNHTDAYGTLSGADVSNVFFEDNFSTVGLNSRTSNQISVSTVSTTTISTTTAYAIRSGGTTLQQYVFPPSGTGNTGLSSSNFPHSYIKLFEYPFYTVANTAYTVSAWFLSTTTAQWSVDPVTDASRASTTPEMFVECDVYTDDVDADRRTIRSNVNNDVDFNGTTGWMDIAVSFTPTQTGNTYCRGWYGKKKETGAAMNQFLMDTKVDITSP